MKIKIYDEKGKEQFVRIPYWSIVKLFFLGFISYMGLVILIGLIALIFSI